MRSTVGNLIPSIVGRICTIGEWEGEWLIPSNAVAPHSHQTWVGYFVLVKLSASNHKL